MPTLILEIHDLDDAIIDVITMEGGNPARAFHYLEENETLFPVKLWREGYRGRTFLGDIRRDDRGVWHIQNRQVEAEVDDA